MKSAGAVVGEFGTSVKYTRLADGTRKALGIKHTSDDDLKDGVAMVGAGAVFDRIEYTRIVGGKTVHLTAPTATR